jgi:acetyl-CoA carboxylase biotin carboxyl carrier protein
MDIRKIKKLIELLEESGIAELEIKEGEESVRISRQPAGYLQQMPAAMAMAQPQAVTAPAAAPVEVARPETGHQVKSPMVGTSITKPHRLLLPLLPRASRLMLAIPCASSKR